MEFEYLLTREEVENSLRLIGEIKDKKKKIIIELIIIGVFFVGFVVSAFIFPEATLNYIAMVILVLLGASVVVLPKREDKNLVDTAHRAVAHPIVIALDDEIHIRVPATGADWVLTGERVNRICENDEMLAVTMTDKRFIAIPKRVLDGEKYDKFISMIKRENTQPEGE